MGLFDWFRGKTSKAEKRRDSEPPKVPEASPPEPANEPYPPMVNLAIPVAPYPPFVTDLRHRPGGDHQSLKLTKDAWVQGVPCRCGFLSFLQNGQLASATLAREHTIDGEALPADTVVVFDENGGARAWSRVLAEERTFIARRGEEGEEELPMTIPAESTIEFEEGKLRSARLSAAVDFDGLHFPADTNLTFGDSGGLSHAWIPETTELAGVRWVGGETVVFLYGRIYEGWPADDGEHSGVAYQAHEQLRFASNGQLVRCYLAADTVLSDIPCAAGTRVYLDEEGRLAEGTLAKDATIRGVVVAAGSTVALIDGVPVGLIPKEDVPQGPWLCAAGEELMYYVSGGLLGLQLAREAPVAGVVASQGARLSFREDGSVRALVSTDGRDEDGKPMPGTWTLLFDEDGSVRYRLPSTPYAHAEAVPLREGTAIEGLVAAAETAVTYLPEGTLESLVLAEDQEIGPFLARGKTRVRFHESGEVASLTLSADVIVDGIPCSRGVKRGSVLNGVEETYPETVSLHADGGVLRATLFKDVVYRGVPLRSREVLMTHKGGALQLGTLSASWAHPSGCVARAGTLLALDAEGQPTQLTLDAASTVDGVEYEAGACLRFAEGAVLSASPSRVPLGKIALVE